MKNSSILFVLIVVFLISSSGKLLFCFVLIVGYINLIREDKCREKLSLCNYNAPCYYAPKQCFCHYDC
ncbi:unnamed protein product [Arabidopsis halleri]